MARCEETRPLSSKHHSPLCSSVFHCSLCLLTPRRCSIKMNLDLGRKLSVKCLLYKGEGSSSDPTALLKKTERIKRVDLCGSATSQPSLIGERHRKTNSGSWYLRRNLSEKIEYPNQDKNITWMSRDLALWAGDAAHW